MAEEPITTRTAKIWLEDEGRIVRIESHAGVEEKLEDAREHVSLVTRLTGETRHSLLVDMRKIKSVERAARRFYAEEPAAKQTLVAMALLVSSPVSKIIGNFVISTFSSSSVRTRMFTSEDDALAWLRGLGE